MNQSEFLAITCNSPEAWEKSRVHGAISFGFTTHWLKIWHDSFKPITKRSNRNHENTFDSHLKTALKAITITITKNSHFHRVHFTRRKKKINCKGTTGEVLAHGSYRILGGQDKDKNHFFKDFNFPTIWHKITRNAITNNLCTAAHSIFLFAKQRFLTEVTLFKELSQIFKDYCGKIKDFSRTFKNFSNFKDYSRTWCFFKDYSRPYGCICYLQY